MLLNSLATPFYTAPPKRLNNCLLLHVHKDVTDTLDLVEIAKEFISVGHTEECRKHFGCFVNCLHKAKNNGN